MVTKSFVRGLRKRKWRMAATVCLIWYFYYVLRHIKVPTIPSIAAMPPSILLMSSYPPKPCGVGEYARQTLEAIELEGVSLFGSVDVVALVDDESHRARHSAQPEVILTLVRGNREDFLEVERIVRQKKYDAILLQHEFAIWAELDSPQEKSNLDQ